MKSIIKGKLCGAQIIGTSTVVFCEEYILGVLLQPSNTTRAKARIGENKHTFKSKREWTKLGVSSGIDIN